MKPIYLFDVDGTLTPPRQEVDEEFADAFLSWADTGARIVYLVTGSDIAKTKEQLFAPFIDRCAGIFTCSGNVFYSKKKLVYKKEVNLPPTFIDDLELYLEHGSAWRTQTGKHIELRPGMVNFSTVGRNASLNLREAYYAWDQISRERQDIVEYITHLYPEFEVSIGGNISVDIYPVGHNKAQVVEHLYAEHGEGRPLIFVGDRNVPGGNDWPLAQRLDQLEGCSWFQVESYHETKALIEANELFS